MPKKPPKILTSQEILDADDCPVVTVEVPEWSGSVKIRPLLRREVFEARDAATVADEIDEDLSGLFMLAAAMVEPQFDHEQIKQLRDKNHTAVARLIDEVIVLQGGGADAVKAFEKSLLE